MTEAVQIHPNDQHNQTLVANVHPPDWQNPTPDGRYNLIAIGAGAAGLVSSAGTAGLGGKSALIEKHLLGGDCLNVGCVPSKALIRSARAVAEIKRAGEFGIHLNGELHVDFAAAMERVRRLRAHISPHDSAERFQGLGVDVYLGHAQFTGPDTIEVEGQALRFKKAVITTGARAFIPPVPGLQESGCLTNETVFNLTENPGRLLVMGGGPIGCELALAMARLGVSVTLIEMSGHVLPREDEDAAAIVQEQMTHNGVELLLNSKLTKVETIEGIRKVTIEKENQEEHRDFDQILVAVGRAPNVQNLGLEAAGVEYDDRTGVHVNDYLQTSNPNIYAAGDSCLKYKFTHSADAAARIVIRNALNLGMKSRVSSLAIPWCTYTEPEIAHIGVTESEAKEQGAETFKREFKEVDRAILEGDTDGFVKIHALKGKIIGATIVGRNAGNLIGEIAVAMKGNVSLGSIASVIHPYPTEAEAIKQVGDMYNRTKLTSTVKNLFTHWLKWQR